MKSHNKLFEKPSNLHAKDHHTFGNILTILHYIWHILTILHQISANNSQNALTQFILSIAYATITLILTMDLITNTTNALLMRPSFNTPFCMDWCPLHHLFVHTLIPMVPLQLQPLKGSHICSHINISGWLIHNCPFAIRRRRCPAKHWFMNFACWATGESLFRIAHTLNWPQWIRQGRDDPDSHL